MRLLTFKYFLILFLFASLSTKVKAQLTETRGNLLRVNFNQSEINTSDTVGNWYYLNGDSYDSYSFYEKIFTFKNTKSFLLFSHYDGPYLPTTSLFLETLTNENDWTVYSYYGYFDIIEPYMLGDTFLQFTENGTWLLNGIYGVSFFYNNQLVEDTSGIVHIAGKIKNNFLVVTCGEEMYDFEFDYLLCDLENSPEVEVLHKISIKKESGGDIFSFLRIEAINDSVFFSAINMDDGFDMFIDRKDFRVSYLQDTTLIILDNNFVNENLTFWSSFSNRIVGLRNNNLIGQTLNLNTLQIEDIDTLARNVPWQNYSLSVDKKYSAFIRNDSLFAFSLENETLLNSWDLSSIDDRYSPIIDSPYVYVHQATTIVGIDNEEKLPNEITLYQNYPNPFNPTTKIKFTIPNVETPYRESLQTKLIVYDILGREIKTLINKTMLPGKYEIEFDGSELTSGIYFYVLEIGAERLRKKMVLLK